ncbi:MAG: sigma-70 family RNA polymerase sigma factor [Chloroflexota bacterium]
MGAKRPAPADPARKLDELFQAHERRVLAYALRRTSSRSDAEDAVAETFTIAWRKIEYLPDDALPWLLAVARRVVANQRRGSERRAWLFVKMRRQATPEPIPLPSGEAADGPALAALGRLRPDDQELLRLIAWDELDQRGIASVLGISANAVAIRLHRARRRFKDEFTKDSGGSRTSTEAKGTINGALQEHGK